MTRDDVEELLRDLHEHDGDTYIAQAAGTALAAALDAYREWLAAEEDPDRFCDPAAMWQCEERQRVKDRARCDLMDAIDRLTREAS